MTRPTICCVAVMVAIAALMAGLRQTAPDSAAPPLNAENWTKWRDFIRPKAEEMRWQSIPWQTSLMAAVEEARKTNKPILLWAMNGHPLACT